MPKPKIIKNIFLGIFLALFIAIGLFFVNLRRNYVVPILMYHSVSDRLEPDNRLSVSVGTFERQMRFLKNHRYNCLPLDTLAVLIKEKKKIPPKTVLLTFDDGYRNVYKNAFPVLKKYNLPATIFIIVNEVGRPQQDRLNWDEIKQMYASGLVSVGSHCLGPEPLVNLKSDDQTRSEIFDSKRILEEKLGTKIKSFSYPEGLFNVKIRELVTDAGYKLALATNPGRDYPDDDIFALKRLRISENAANLFIFRVEVSGYYTWMKESKKKHKK